MWRHDRVSTHVVAMHQTSQLVAGNTGGLATYHAAVRYSGEEQGCKVAVRFFLAVDYKIPDKRYLPPLFHMGSSI